MAPACLLLVTGYAGCHQEIAIASYTMALFCVGPFFSGAKVNVNDLTMHYGGTIMALINGMGCLAGILATSMIGLLTCDCSLESWQLVFLILFGICTVCTIFYCIFASADRQEWDFKDDIPATES
nr:unnamed protein product [Callosobruchus analis]